MPFGLLNRWFLCIGDVCVVECVEVMRVRR
jgi:hypothetical protein